MKSIAIFRDSITWAISKKERINTLTEMHTFVPSNDS